MKKIIFTVFALTVICMAITFTGCGKYEEFKNTVPHTIDSSNKAKITIEAGIKPMAIEGVLFVSAQGIPSPEEGVYYSSIEIPANVKKTIKIRVLFGSSLLKSKDDIDKEIDFDLPSLAAGSYSLAFKYGTKDQFGYLVNIFITAKINNKRVELKDSSGNVLAEYKL